MKKTVIKRRKRIVGLPRTRSPNDPLRRLSNASSASPDMSPATLAHDYRDVDPLSPPQFAGATTAPPPPPPFMPPPVDFTGYGAPLQHQHQHQPPPPPPPPPRLLEPEEINVRSSSSIDMSRQSSSPGALLISGGGRNDNNASSNNPRKRALSDVSASATPPPPRTLEPSSSNNQLPPLMFSAQPARLQPISSLLNHQAEDHPPPTSSSSLAEALISQSQKQLPGIRELDYRSGRRVQLQREAERIREELAAKERELAWFGA